MTNYASEYEEYLYKLLTLLENKYTFQQVDTALIQNNLMSRDVYEDLSSNAQMERITRFKHALGIGVMKC